MEHGLRHTGATPTRASLTPPPDTLLHTPLRRAHLAPLREILGCRTPVLDGVKVSRLFPPVFDNLECGVLLHHYGRKDPLLAASTSAIEFFKSGSQETPAIEAQSGKGTTTYFEISLNSNKQKFSDHLSKCEFIRRKPRIEIYFRTRHILTSSPHI